jgi:hypothetical protein
LRYGGLFKQPAGEHSDNYAQFHNLIQVADAGKCGDGQGLGLSYTKIGKMGIKSIGQEGLT